MEWVQLILRVQVEISISFTVDDYSRYTWAILLREKSKSFDLERKLFSRLQIEKIFISLEFTMIMIKNLKNTNFIVFVMNRVYIKNFLLLYITLWHNGIVERKNKVIQEMAWNILNNEKVTLYLWGETVNIIVHILNRVGVRPGNKTHSLWVIEQQESMFK